MTRWSDLRPISGALLRAMLHEGESEHLEFKRTFTGDGDLSRVLVALENSGGGTLVIGVGDDGVVEGLDPATARQAEHLLAQLCRSIVPWGALVSSMEVNGRFLVYAVVPQPPETRALGTTPEGRAFVRRGSRIEEVPFKAPVENATAVSPTGNGPLRGFVAMSFREGQEPALIDYFEAMKRAADSAKCAIELARMDQKEGDFDIPAEIMREIDAADFVVADLTLSPPNVYFEIGYARGREVTVLQACRQDTGLEFDVRNQRTLFYRNATELERKLKAAFDALCDSRQRVNS